MMGVADHFLEQVEATVSRVLNKDNNNDLDILTLDPKSREAVGVARNLKQRLEALRRNNDCPTCWMQRAHCICNQCTPIHLPKDMNINRIFLLVHHKEIGLKVDTVKLLLASFPEHCRLVVGGIGSEFQQSMAELEQTLENENCIILFPDDNAQTASELDISAFEKQGMDLVVLDGTWTSASKLHRRYIPSTARRVQLSETSLDYLRNGNGHQLRRHPTTWRQIGTFEATRLFLNEIGSADDALKPLATYQDIANEAARRELGPPRSSSKPI
jgi:DTW domain-containing protein YfiP